MRSFTLAGPRLPMLGAIVAGGLLLTAHAARAEDGDEICSKSGQIWAYDVVARDFLNVGGHCKPKGSAGLADGDKKCGVSNLIVRYDAKLNRWWNTGVQCTGGRSDPDLHLENLHPGTEAARPAGWGGDEVSAPGAH
jgi:hypothetical protein